MQTQNASASNHLIPALTSFFLALFLLNACATSENKISEDVVQNESSQSNIDDLILSLTPEMEALRDLQTTETGDDESEELKLVMTRDVQRWIDYFVTRDRDRFQEFLDRGATYRPYIEATLRDMGLPRELYYLGMIESGYVIHATSRAAASGAWQFIKPTATRYGLRVNHEIDERHDIMRATVAAASYLRDLHAMFQSWFLAMAAYNAGEARVMGAIVKADTRDFWALASEQVLPPETRNYVPKFIAAVIIGEQPERFGFHKPTTRPWPELTKIRAPSRVRVADIAHSLEIPESVILKFNPNIKKRRTPDQRRDYELWIPKNLEAQAAQNSHRLAVIDRTTVSRKANIAEKRSRSDVRAAFVSAPKMLKSRPIAAVDRYRVRRGDNLNAIAKKFGTSTKALMQINKLRRTTLYQGQVLDLGLGKS